ncbi:GMP/IMP nucleotidase [Solimonas sp. SE-A11]|uniref:GMP/IMP nucleotidase n=1 Tax=Solimonas sp. SE-A11 TaxID=3054954 RepID=UPI00259C93DF|nr:GMP/IMP nucleotidase [Solimonas sp. SE-A11]MDM4772995.1 GMP/IMP nucleotidase [Solimonas sp. SE-A11]
MSENLLQVDWSRADWVILDMDGTILDLAYDNYFWRELIPERYAWARGLSLEDARAELLPRFVEVQHTLPWYCTDYWSDITGLDVAGLKREIRQHIRALEGAEDFLRHVRDSGRQLWLATNAHRDSWTLKMEQTGLGHYFHHIVSSHDYGAPKEDPLFWQRFLADKPFERERAMFVDDSLPVLQAARRFGVGQVVGLRHPDSTQPSRADFDWHPAADRIEQLIPR